MNLLTNTMIATQAKNPLVIYHGNCADGFSAAWVFHYMQDKIKQSFDFHAGVYNDAPPDVSGRVVYLADFSYKRAVVANMCDKAEKVILIDHHKTALDDLAGLQLECRNFEHYTDLDRSGAMLAWDYWNNYTTDVEGDPVTMEPGDGLYVPPPLLLNHIQDRDLWRFKLANTREIQANVFSFEYTFENWDKLMSAGQAELLQMTVAGAAIERKHHKDIKELVNVCQRFMDIFGYTVPVASLPYTLSSDAGHVMAESYKNGCYFAACYIDTTEHRIFSLRSEPHGIDVSLVAKAYGGGGHKNAAGFRVTRDHELATR